MESENAAAEGHTTAVPLHPLERRHDVDTTRASVSYAESTPPTASTSAAVGSSSSTTMEQAQETSSTTAKGTKNFSLLRRKSGSTPIDYLREPRRSIGKRPDELSLGLRDPHLGQKGRQRRKVPFAAPYERSGVVLAAPARFKDWAIPGPLAFGRGQWLYLVVAQSLVAACISGAINFGVAVALYRGKPSVNIWTFNRQTVAGDMGVTLIIQQVVSFIITSSLVHRDLVIGPIGPLRRPWPPLLHLPSTPSPDGQWLGVRMSDDVHATSTPLYMGRSEGKSRLNAWWWWFVRAIMTGSERNDILAAGISWRQRLERLIWTAAQGFFLCCLTFWWYWPIAIAIVAPTYEHRELAGTYIPMIIKLLYGAIMSLLTNPIMALMAMGAESSVRRCYPELDIWTPFGGAQDTAHFKAQLHSQTHNHTPPPDVEKQTPPVAQ